MFSMWIMHLAMWCLVQAVTESCDKGDMIASTDSVVLPGSNITFSCRLKQGERCKELIFNSSEIVLTYGRHTFICKCKSNEKLICGIDIYVGNPPDQPRNVSCIQYGRDGHITCTWDKGRPTHIETTYVVQLTNETECLSFSEDNVENPKYGSLKLTKLNFESNYTAVVAASNRLGNASSLPFTFMFIDIVKPHSPTDILVKFDNFSATNCTVLWQDQQQTQSCRLRYRPTNSHFWNMVETLNATRYYLRELKPHTEYEFQVCCRFHPNRGIWSEWSTFRIQTPEAAPTGLLDVWYIRQDMDSQKQNITLFWKVMSKSEARGKILHYTLSFQALKQKSPRMTNVTTQTHYVQVLPKVDHNITVCAHNSKGNSPLTSIVTDLSILDLPPPQNISITPLENNSICVMWEPPIESAAFINGYIVKWAETNSPGPHLNWIKFSASQLSTIISESIKQDVCYDIHVFALYSKRTGRAAAARGYSKQKAPSAGPQISTAVKGNGVWVSWEEIPDAQQMGCITSYKIYLLKKTSEAGLKVYDIPIDTSRNSFLITNLQHDVNYVLWMTASTMAGESPKGNEELVYLESLFAVYVDVKCSGPKERLKGWHIDSQSWVEFPNGSSEWIIVLAACIFFGISAFFCLVQSAQKDFLLAVLVPKWYRKAIPDPANSTWAKKYSSIEDELNLRSNQFVSYLSSFEEPETIEVEEVFMKSEPAAFKDISIFNIKSSEDHHWPTIGNSFEKPESAEQNSEYRPLVASTPEDGDNYKCHLPYLYKKVILEETEQISEYLANPLTDMTVNYLPSNILSPIMDTNEEGSEFECKSFSIFSTTSLLMPVFSYGGKLTLDAVKIDSSSCTE